MSNSKLPKFTKKAHLNQLADYRDNTLKKKPELRRLFLEMTIQCNEHCRHCGSLCGDIREENRLTKEELCSFLDTVKKDFPLERFMLCVTGGEPLLRPDFFEIMEHAHKLGMNWGMTSNATLINKEVAHKLKETGMKTVSVSVDGLKISHEWFRQSLNSYEKTMSGIQNLLEQNFAHVQITTVIHALNIHELEEMYETFKKVGVKSWRVINIEPIGRAAKQPELLLSNEQYKTLFDFIRKHRFEDTMSVEYGCSHYLGLDYEREVRPWYFLCNAGLYVASICYNGDITSCLDLERRKEYIEGNIRKDSFKEVWEKGFQIYRTDYRKKGKCATCKEYIYCQGDSFHSWNLDKQEPNVCLKGILF